jgi:Asp-tRNA(Asn)/Glu-tRNA(Gln) amidotransferase A subunit family amidase
MGKSSRDMTISMRVACDPNSHLLDPLMTPMAFNEENYKSIQNPRGIKVGVVTLDPSMPITKASERAMEITKKALKDLGYEVVGFIINPEEWKLFRDILMNMFANGAAILQSRDLIDSGETVLGPLKKNFTILDASWSKRCIIDFALKYILNSGRLYDVLDGGRNLNDLDFE